MISSSRLKQWYKSVQTRFTLAVIITAAILVETTAAVQYWFAHEEIKREVKNRAETELRVKTLEIEKVMSAVETAANTTAWMIEDAIATGSDLGNVMYHMLKSNTSMTGCGLGFIENYYPWHGRWYELYVNVNDSTKARQIGGKDHDYLQQEWYKNTIDSNNSYWTEPYYDDAGGHTLLITFAQPIHDRQGKVVAVFGADVSLEWLSKVLNAHHIYPSSYNVIVSRQGQIMACPVGDSAANRTSQQMKGGQTGETTVTGDDGQKNYVFYAPIRRDSADKNSDTTSLGWTMAVICNDNEIYHSLRQLGFHLLLLMGIGLALLTFIMFRAIKAMKQLHDVNEQKQRIESELNIARGIQQAMLPKIFPPYPERKDIDIYASLLPAREVGGDFYDFMIRDEKLFFCIGDVSGKGVPAALVMAVMRTLFRNVASHQSQPSQMLETMNNTVAESNDTCMFITMFVGVLDLKTGLLQYANAGHDAPLLIKDNTSQMEVEPNLPLGVMEGMTFQQHQTTLDGGTTLFMFTDGLTEAENNLHEQFGLGRVMKTSLTTAMPREYVENMAEAVKTFVGEAEQSDDLTMMAIRKLKN